MIAIKREEVSRWKLEIEQGEEFRREQFGCYNHDDKYGVSRNLDYYECGYSAEDGQEWHLNPIATLNIIFPIVKNIIPSLYYRNPHVLVLPNRRQDEDSAPIAGEILNYYYKELDIKEVNQQVVFDAYVLGMGVSKIGYATQFGADIEDPNAKKRKEESRVRKFLGAMGIGKKKPEEVRQNPDLNEFIKTEKPYVVWISPFDFIIDPRANSIHDAQWVAHRIRKTLSEVKSNKNYSNTSNLQPSPIERKGSMLDLDQTNIEKFQTIDLYEIHYKTDEGINILTLAKDQQDYKALRHEKSVYKMDGFQFEVLTFNKHSHKLYPQSEITIIRPLQDEISDVFDSILDQVRKLVPKVFVDDTGLTADGRLALEQGGVGALIKCNRAPKDVVEQANFTQVKTDLSVFIEKLIDIVALIVGLTRAQLTGLTSAETATEAQIGQSGQNLRRSNQGDIVQDFINKQSRKLWQIISDPDLFDLQDLEFITGEPITNQQGQTQYNWLQVNPDRAKKLIQGEFAFDIEVGSAQKPDLAVIRQQITNVARDLFNPVVDQQLIDEGTKLSHTELLRAVLRAFPDVFRSPEKILQQATPQQQLQNQLRQQAEVSGRGNSIENAGGNAPRTPPTATTIQEQVYGEQGGGAT